MSETSPRPQPRVEYEIGQRVPLEKPKLDVRPMHFVDDPARGPRNLFRNGGNKR